jgi:2-C-methyl-D-erythritol 4-phosphate cytidylyltransferase
MDKEYKIGTVIVAAGSGSRFGERKQFKKLKGKPLYLYSLEKFTECDSVDDIALVVPHDLVEDITNDLLKLNKKINVVAGGELRQDSVLEGVKILDDECEIICIHDAARPFITIPTIENAIETAVENDGAVVSIPSHDTVKEIVKNTNRIKRTIPRETVWMAQTPQVFHRDKLLQALAYANTNGISVTDESTLLESLDFAISVVQGSPRNFKVTTQEDWQFAKIILEEQND